MRCGRLARAMETRDQGTQIVVEFLATDCRSIRIRSRLGTDEADGLAKELWERAVRAFLTVDQGLLVARSTGGDYQDALSAVVRPHVLHLMSSRETTVVVDAALEHFRGVVHGTAPGARVSEMVALLGGHQVERYELLRGAATAWKALPIAARFEHRIALRDAIRAVFASEQAAELLRQVPELRYRVELLDAGYRLSAPAEPGTPAIEGHAGSHKSVLAWMAVAADQPRARLTAPRTWPELVDEVRVREYNRLLDNGPPARSGIWRALFPRRRVPGGRLFEHPVDVDLLSVADAAAQGDSSSITKIDAFLRRHQDFADGTGSADDTRDRPGEWVEAVDDLLATLRAVMRRGRAVRLREERGALSGLPELVDLSVPDGLRSTARLRVDIIAWAVEEIASGGRHPDDADDIGRLIQQAIVSAKSATNGFSLGDEIELDRLRVGLVQAGAPLADEPAARDAFEPLRVSEIAPSSLRIHTATTGERDGAGLVRWIPTRLLEVITDAIGRSLAGQAADVLTIAGPAAAGKSRLLFEALKHAPRHTLVLPADPTAEPQDIAAALVRHQHPPFVLIFDDLQRFTLGTTAAELVLKAAEARRGPTLIVLVCGSGSEPDSRAASHNADLRRALESHALAPPVWVTPASLDLDDHLVRQIHGDAIAQGATTFGLGGFLVGTDLLEQAYRLAPDQSDGAASVSGVAIANALLALRALGVPSGSRAVVRAAWRAFVVQSGHEVDEAWRAGLGWVSRPVVAGQCVAGWQTHAPFELEINRALLSRLSQEELERLAGRLLAHSDGVDALHTWVGTDPWGLRALRVGDGALIAGHRSLAIEYYERAASKGLVAGSNNLGVVLAETPGREDDAERALRNAAGSPEAYVNLGHLLAAQPGRWREAADAYRRADVAVGWKAQGALLEDHGCYHEAIEAFIKADDGEAWEAIGLLRARTSPGSEGALDALVEAESRGRSSATLHRARLMSREKGRSGEALIAARAALAAGVSDAGELCGLLLASAGATLDETRAALCFASTPVSQTMLLVLGDRQLKHEAKPDGGRFALTVSSIAVIADAPESLLDTVTDFGAAQLLDAGMPAAAVELRTHAAAVRAAR